MEIRRRDFLKSSAALSAFAAVGTPTLNGLAAADDSYARIDNVDIKSG